MRRDTFGMKCVVLGVELEKRERDLIMYKKEKRRKMNIINLNNNITIIIL